MDISKLDTKQFAIIFSKIMEKIKEDPIENFVKAGGFIDLTPTPAQEVILKTVFGKELDAISKKEVLIEDTGSDDVFKLKKVLMTEVEIYNFLTEATYDSETNDVVFNNIDLICGRRCLEAGTLVATPQGPIKIEDLKVGDEVYGLPKSGIQTLTKVKNVFNQGICEVTPLIKRGIKYAACTRDHRWLLYKNQNKDYRGTFEGTIDKLDKYNGIKLNLTPIDKPGISVKNTYTLGALLGDGCSRQGSTNNILISSQNDILPKAIIEELGIGELKRYSEYNYTWAIGGKNIANLVPKYEEWCNKKYSYDKKIDIEELKKWDKKSLLKLLAGLLDTDGSVYKTTDGRLMVNFTSGSKSLIDGYCWIIQTLFKHHPIVRIDKRDKYKNGDVYYAVTNSNLYSKLIIKNLEEYSKLERKSWKDEYSKLLNYNCSPEYMGLKLGTPYAAPCYDIEVSNDSNLYILSNGLVTHNSGKTLLAAIIAIYCAISNNWKPFLKKTPFATVLILSHSRDFSDEVLEVIRTLIQNSEILNKLINSEKKNTSATMNLKIPWIVSGKIEYSRVQIKVAAASSKTTRGVAACAILCDEIGVWNVSENMVETDAKILAALRPSTKQFGNLAMLIKLSSPGIRQGVLYGEYKASREKTLPDSYAVFKAPTWMMNNIIPEKEFQDEYKLDKDGFDVEYRSNFADSLSNFILPEFVDMSILKGVLFQPPEVEAIKYSGAIDAAYKNDAFTFTVTGFVNGRLRQYISKGWKGSKTKPVSPHEVAEYVRTICKQYNMDFVAADQYSFQPLKEIFDRYNVTLQEYTFTPDFKKKIYFNLKKLVNSQQIDLLDLEIQTRELKELMVEQTSTGHVKIGHPNGGSDDYATSLAISSYLATQGLSADHFNFDSSIPIKSYGLDTDVNGISYKAPSIDLLVQSGHLTEITTDNSDQYEKDPKTGKLVRIEDLDEEGGDDDGSSFTF